MHQEPVSFRKLSSMSGVIHGWIILPLNVDRSIGTLVRGSSPLGFAFSPIKITQGALNSPFLLLTGLREGPSLLLQVMGGSVICRRGKFLLSVPKIPPKIEFHPWRVCWAGPHMGMSALLATTSTGTTSVRPDFLECLVHSCLFVVCFFPDSEPHSVCCISQNQLFVLAVGS